MMAEFNIQSDSVDVTRIMEQLRQRIREKRGTDYTEQQTHELATVKLERFLDPRQVRSDLVEHFRKLEPPAALEPIPHEKPEPAPEPFNFDEHTIYASSRGTMGKLIRLIRKLLNPILKLFVNPDPVVFALSRQAEINVWTLQLLQQQTDLAERVTKQFERAGAKFAAREELDALNYEVLNNLVVEMSRLSVDMKNHRMLVESVAGRLDFDERRARALESVVQSRTPQPAGGQDAPAGEGGESTSSTEAGRPRRRRRRSRRRSGAPAPDSGKATAPGTVARGESAESAPDRDIAARPTDTAASAPVAEPSEAPPEPSAPPPTAPSRISESPTSPASLPVDDAGAQVSPPAPVTPSPVDTPAPSTSDPVVAAAPSTPDPVVASTPSTPDPVVAPAPSTPDPVVAPAPVTPDPDPVVAPAPVTPDPDPVVAPAPLTPDPVTTPAPAAAPATETVTRPSPEGETGNDEQ
jgi:hypothetical protein